VKRISVLAIAAVAALALAAAIGAASASATVLCKSAPASHVCTSADVYGKGTHVSAHNGSTVIFKNSGGATVFSCTAGAFSGNVLEPGSATTPTALEAGYEFSGCSYASSSLQNGSGGVEWTSGTHNGTFWEMGDEVRWNIFGVNCDYTVWGPTEVKGGSSASLVYKETKLLKTAGSGICWGELKMNAGFVVESPAPLYVEHEAEAAPPPAESVLCGSSPEDHVCPAEDVYGAGTGISAQSVPNTPIVLKTLGGSKLAECAAGAFSGVISAAGGEGNAANIGETRHTYEGCSTSATPVGTGEAELDWTSGSVDGLLAQTGGGTEWALFGIKCTYVISGGEVEGGAEPKLVYNGTMVDKTAGGGLCPSHGMMYAEYDIESPTPLYVEQK
jgi:hypothetical protein